jgi:hypothetical protein
MGIILRHKKASLRIFVNWFKQKLAVKVDFSQQISPIAKTSQ